MAASPTGVLPVASNVRGRMLCGFSSSSLVGSLSKADSRMTRRANAVTVKAREAAMMAVRAKIAGEQQSEA